MALYVQLFLFLNRRVSLVVRKAGRVGVRTHPRRSRVSIVYSAEMRWIFDRLQ